MLLNQAIVLRQRFRITGTGTVSLTETKLNWLCGRRAMLPERSTKANFYTYSKFYEELCGLRLLTMVSNCSWGTFCFAFDKLLRCTGGIVLLL